MGTCQILKYPCNKILRQWWMVARAQREHVECGDRGEDDRGTGQLARRAPSNQPSLRKPLISSFTLSSVRFVLHLRVCHSQALPTPAPAEPLGRPAVVNLPDQVAPLAVACEEAAHRDERDDGGRAPDRVMPCEVPVAPELDARGRQVPPVLRLAQVPGQLKLAGAHLVAGAQLVGVHPVEAIDGDDAIVGHDARHVGAPLLPPQSVQPLDCRLGRLVRQVQSRPPPGSSVCGGQRAVPELADGDARHRLVGEGEPQQLLELVGVLRRLQPRDGELGDVDWLPKLVQHVQPVLDCGRVHLAREVRLDSDCAERHPLGRQPP
mmetsp:Transcript_16079/g.52367  ORF Transcript_16079/g.52367 Transcript_16079/m.52367 type:complete len:321 (+) Transcript_16079:1-963(+)